MQALQCSGHTLDTDGSSPQMHQWAWSSPEHVQGQPLHPRGSGKGRNRLGARVGVGPVAQSSGHQEPSLCLWKHRG